jgi:DoxX-like family
MKIIYWIVTGLFCLMMLGSAGMYIVNHAEVLKIFSSLGYPTYIVYPLAIAKILGVIAILSKQSKILKEWAYAGFFFNLLLAASAHYFAGVPSPLLAIIGLVLLLISYTLDKKIYG